jgi:site-specific DNA-methyltransferase (cytosine-N4-specific)
MNQLRTSEIYASYYPNESQIILGDSLEGLRKFPSQIFRACVTSPPYWGLRDYGIPHQIGAEKNISDYLRNLRLIFREVRRTLSDNGTLWLNIGDTYTSGNRTWRGVDKKNPARAMTYRPPTPTGLKPKDLIGLPWRLAFALQEDGWYLRSDIVWYKPNCQPESVRDRPTRSHEYIFLFSKSEQYLYNADSIKEKSNGDPNRLRNRRTMWAINTEASEDAHFATFPIELVKPCILAATNADDFVLDPFFGSGTVGEVCKLLGRKFIGIELKKEYIEIAKRRLKWKDPIYEVTEEECSRDKIPYLNP